MAMSEALTNLGEKIVAGLGGAATGHSIAFGQLTVAVHADRIVEVVKFLRDDAGCRFVSFIDVTAVDYPGREKRFDVVYHLLSPTLNERIRLRAEASETTLLVVSSGSVATLRQNAVILPSCERYCSTFDR